MYPFIIDGYTIDTSVQQEAVEEVVEFHRKINGTQVIAVYTENEFRKIFGEQATVNKTLEYLYVKAGIKKQVGWAIKHYNTHHYTHHYSNTHDEAYY